MASGDSSPAAITSISADTFTPWPPDTPCPQVPPAKDGHGLPGGAARSCHGGGKDDWKMDGTNPVGQVLTSSSLQNWGLMIFDTDALLIDPASASEEDR